MKYDTARPYAASFVILRRKNEVAFVLRSGTDWMNGYYGLPAGKVEVGESFCEAAIREAKEEAGVTIDPTNLRPVLACHRQSDDETLAWVDVFFEVTVWEGEPFNAEPDKHSELAWFGLDDLPKNLLAPNRFALQNIQAGNSYCEYNWEA